MNENLINQSSGFIESEKKKFRRQNASVKHEMIKHNSSLAIMDDEIWRMSETEHYELDAGQNDCHLLSSMKMMQKVNMNHPRIFEEGVTKPVPLNTSMGKLLGDDPKEVLPVYQLGIATTQYFKLLKALFKLMIVGFILNIPSMMIYYNGLGYFDLELESFNKLARITIGNLGQNWTNC